MQEIYYVKDLEQLKILSEPLRVKILWELDYGAQTGKMLSVKLGLPASKMRYHLTTLEKAGLAEIEKTEVMNGIVQKFYRPIAKVISLEKVKPLINKNEESIENTLLFNMFESLERTQNFLKRVDMQNLYRENLIQYYSSVSLSEADIKVVREKIEDVAHFIQERQKSEDTIEKYHISITGFPIDGENIF